MLTMSPAFAYVETIHHAGLPADIVAAADTARDTRPSRPAGGDRPIAPVMREIGRPRPMVPNASELARLAVADTRTAHERVLDRVADRLVAALAEPRPNLRLVREEGMDEEPRKAR